MAKDKKPRLFASTQPNQGSLLSLPVHKDTLRIDAEFEETFTRYYSDLWAHFEETSWNISCFNYS
jgi:hypothetical protein